MAARYGVAGSNWNWSNHNSWSATSGGSPGTSVPTINDDVILDANTHGQIGYIDITAACKSLNMRDWYGELNFALSLTTHGSIELPANPASKLKGGSIFRLQGGGSQTITTHGCYDSNNFRLDSATATWNLLDDFPLSTDGGSFQFYNGTLNTGGYSLSIPKGALSFSAGGVQALNLGVSLVEIGYNVVFSAATSLGADEATINFINEWTGAPHHLDGGGINRVFGDVSWPMIQTINAEVRGGSHSFRNLNFRTNGAALHFSGNATISGTLDAGGPDSSTLSALGSTGPGTQRTISAEAVNLSNLIISDIAATGPAAPWSGTNLIDGGNNSGITF